MKRGLLIFTALLGVSAANRSTARHWLSNKPPILDSPEQIALFQEALDAFNYGSDKLTMLDIRDDSGGLEMIWVDWFEDIAQFVYVGLGDQSMNVSSIPGVHFETGLPLDNCSILNNKYGLFDVVLLDSATLVSMQVTDTFRNIFDCMANSSVIVVYNMSPGVSQVNAEVVNEVVRLHTVLHGLWTVKTTFQDAAYTGKVKSIQLVEGLAVITKGHSPKYSLATKGDVKIPYYQYVYVKYRLENDGVLEFTTDVGTQSTNIPHAKINEDCRILCRDFTEIREQFSSLEQCVKGLKRDVIHGAFYSNEPFLHDDEA